MKLSLRERALVEMTGMPSAQAMGRAGWPLLHPDDRERVFAEWLAATAARNFSIVAIAMSKERKVLALSHLRAPFRPRRCPAGI